MVQGIFADLIGFNRLGNNVFYNKHSLKMKSTYNDQLLRFLMEHPDKKIQLEARRTHHAIHSKPSQNARKMYRSRFSLYS